MSQQSARPVTRRGCQRGIKIVAAPRRLGRRTGGSDQNTTGISSCGVLSQFDFVTKVDPPK